MQWHLFNRRAANNRGQVLLLFTFFVVIVIMFVGLGVDLGFAYVTKAQLSKAVDAAALTGVRHLSLGDTQVQALMQNAFEMNYGHPGRDAGTVTPTVTFVTDAITGQRRVQIAATTTINTFFIRIFPAFRTLTVAANAETTRNRLIISLVLDRSGSMVGDGGAAALPSAVGHFVDQFDDSLDRASMSSFSWAASTDVPMGQPFKAAIKIAANALNFNGWTCSERGLTNALAENNSVVLLPDENAIKVIVFFSDGLANTWYYNFDCGPRNMSPDRSLYDPNTGNLDSGGCTVPATIQGLSGLVDTSDQCGNMYAEAEARARAVASLARSQGNVIYAVGFGDPSGSPECGHPPLNIEFFKSLANTTDSITYDKSQLVGDYAIAATPGDIDSVLQDIATKILIRLTR